MNINDTIKQYRGIALAKFTSESAVLPTLGAVCSGGLPLICVQPTGASTRETLTRAVNTFPDIMIGMRASSVEQAKLACGCGMHFVCSPFLSEEMDEICREEGLQYLPGALTPTEVIKAAALGRDTVMLSPAYMFPSPDALCRFASSFQSMTFVADCAESPELADTLAGAHELLGVITPHIVAPADHEKTAALTFDFVRKHREN